MRQGSGFVSNSSSCLFLITNLTDQDLTIVDFAKETLYLVDKGIERYDWWENRRTPDNKIRKGIKASRNEFLDDAEQRLVTYNEEIIFPANKQVCSSFGDEDGDFLGCVYDYMLRDGGSTDSFRWRFNKYER